MAGQTRMLDDLNKLIREAVLIAPKGFTPLASLDEFKPFDTFTMHMVNDIDLIIDKAEETIGRYKNIYLVDGSPAVLSFFAGLFASGEAFKETLFECNVFYLHFDVKTGQYLPYKMNEF